MKELPQSLLQELRAIRSFDEEAFVAAHQQAAVTSVRLHPAKQSKAFVQDANVPWCGEGRYLPERPVFTLDPLYHAGAYYVQEASSMFLDHVLRSTVKEKDNLRVLDLCAAPGGKSTLIASFLDGKGLLVSNEVIRTRASILEENITRWGYMNTWVTSNDPRDFGKLKGYFDVIVVDAPCSGSGLFRKDAHALDEWSEANVQLCSGRQQRILADVWDALEEDGILIYATCSYSPAEDEQILDMLAGTYKVESLKVPVPEEWGIVTVNSTQYNMAGYRFFPDKVKGEGFFIAAIRKKEAVDTIRYPKYKTINDKKAQQQMAHLLQPADYCVIKGEDEYTAILQQHEADWHLLKTAVYIRKAGIAVGSPTPKEWLPAHDVALSVAAADALPSIEVSKEQALRFLKKEDMAMADLAKGWHIVQYEGLGLGWVKSLGNRINNYLPKHWRIRMDIPDMEG